MTQLNECTICNGLNNVMRDHCAYCGAKRIFIASHSYEPYCVQVKAKDSDSGRELVRAYRSDIAFTFITAK